MKVIGQRVLVLLCERLPRGLHREGFHSAVLELMWLFASCTEGHGFANHTIERSIKIAILKRCAIEMPLRQYKGML